MKVSALSQNFIDNYVEHLLETWNRITGARRATRACTLEWKKVQTAERCQKKLLACDGVSAVAVNADMLNQVNNMMKSLDAVILLIIVCAGALAFIVIYNLTNINITERIREIATIKVLGFFPKETAAYVYCENIVLTAVGALAGLFAGVWLHRFVMANINVDMIAFDVRILPLKLCEQRALDVCVHAHRGCYHVCEAGKDKHGGIVKECRIAQVQSYQGITWKKGGFCPL